MQKEFLKLPWGREQYFKGKKERKRELLAWKKKEAIWSVIYKRRKGCIYIHQATNKQKLTKPEPI